MDFETAKKDIKGFSAELVADPTIADNFTDDQLTELLNEHLDPTRQMMMDEDRPRYVKLSCVNTHKRFQTRFLTTGMIGYLFRELSEAWSKPEDGTEPLTHEVYLEKMKRFNDLTLPEQKRLIVYEFLSKVFHYNPDHHVRTSYYPNAYDPERANLLPEREKYDADDKRKAEKIKEKLAKLPVRRTARDNPEPTPEPKKAVTPNDETGDEKSDQPEKKVDPGPIVEPKKKTPEEIALEAQVPIQVDEETLKTFGVVKGQLMIPPSATKIAKDNTDDLRKCLVQNLPPAEWFYRLEYYMDHNFEEIRKATQDIYPEKPWVDLMFNVYDIFDSLEKAKEWDDVQGKDVSMDIQTVKAGGWTVLESFKKNRNAMVFDDKNTKVLSEMLAQIEADKKVGAKLLQKRKQRLKDDQLREIGPDAKEFMAWRSENKEDLDEYNIDERTAAIHAQHNKDSMASRACPDDAVQIDVHVIKDGGKTTEKTEVFIEAEDPEEIHMYNASGQELGSGMVNK